MELPKIKCEKCGHTWIPRVENPVKCSKCGHILGTRIYKQKEAETPYQTINSKSTA